MKTLKVLQLIFEILVALGFLIGLLPFGYIVAMWWVIPMTIANLVFSIIHREGTLGLDIANIIMAFMALIPILGFSFRVAGIIIAIIAAVKTGNNLKRW